MAPINRAGPNPLRSLPRMAILSAADVDGLTREGAWIVDARDRVAFANEHIPGAVNVEMNNTFASYVGWTIPYGSQIALVIPTPSPTLPQGGGETLEGVRAELLRI